jgi:PAS domain S-box-containing protein
MLLTALCLTASILGYGAYTAKKQTDSARQTITAQMAALAQNLATINAFFLVTNDFASIETITLQTATVPGIFSVLVTDSAGKPLSEVVNQNGRWSPRFSFERVIVPASTRPVTLIETAEQSATQRDFLAGGHGKISTWHPVAEGASLGWVRVSYRLDSFDQIARDIWTQAMLVIALAIGATLFLLAQLLHPRMRALRAATRFAGDLDHALGTQIAVSTGSAEIEDLGNALNLVSTRLFSQNNDLTNQKFALDQHAIVSITDLNGAITYANDRFCEISGYAREELIGENHRIVKSDFHRPEVYSELWHTITQGQVWHGEVKNRKKNGEPYWVAATIVPLLGPDGLPM